MAILKTKSIFSILQIIPVRR